jgi:hypothetical protein
LERLLGGGRFRNGAGVCHQCCTRASPPCFLPPQAPEPEDGLDMAVTTTIPRGVSSPAASRPATPTTSRACAHRGRYGGGAHRDRGQPSPDGGWTRRAASTWTAKGHRAGRVRTWRGTSPRTPRRPYAKARALENYLLKNFHLQIDLAIPVEPGIRVLLPARFQGGLLQLLPHRRWR